MAVVAGIAVGSCVHPPRKMSRSDAKACTAQGGYESRSPFGFPFCQFRYSDGGKQCSGKSDCEGRCLHSVDGGPKDPVPKPGDPAKGLCEAEKSSFGCYAVVEDGKIAGEGAICWD